VLINALIFLISTVFGLFVVALLLLFRRPLRQAQAL